MNELKTEVNGKFEEVRSEWKEEKQFMDNEKSFWQRALLSLVEMLHSATSGSSGVHVTKITLVFLTGSYLWQYWTQQREAFQKVEDSIEDLRGK